MPTPYTPVPTNTPESRKASRAAFFRFIRQLEELRREYYIQNKTPPIFKISGLWHELMATHDQAREHIAIRILDSASKD